MHKKDKITASNSNARILSQSKVGKGAPPLKKSEFTHTKINSNVRIMSGNRSLEKSSSDVVRTHVRAALSKNSGLNSDQLRIRMVDRLRCLNQITDNRVLLAMTRVQRQFFMDQGTAIRAYEDEALPIGFGQTISKPSVVARMISLIIENRTAGKVLEIGSGCGYQAAILACIFKEVYSIERIAALHALAKKNIAKFIDMPKIQFTLGDGMLGLPEQAPFDAIIVAAAGLEIPHALLSQLKVGGRLIAPEGEKEQRLVLIERVSSQGWSRTELEETRFVPLVSGIRC